MPRIPKFRLFALVTIFYFLTQIYIGNIRFVSPQNNYQRTSVLGVSDPAAKPDIKPYWHFDQTSNSNLTQIIDIEAQSAMAINLTSNQIFFSKNPAHRLPIASLNKIMTAVVAMQNKRVDEGFLVSTRSASVEPDSMGLFPGEKLTLKQLIQGMMLVSGNDAAETIAEGVAETNKEFVKLMNQKAADLGLKNTLFSNPSGLEDDKEHYSTAEDLAILTKFALNNDQFREIIRKKEILIPYTVNETENHKNFYLVNSSPLINYPGYLGVKPGYTPKAKKCLITLVKINNSEVLTIVLGSDNRKGDTEVLLDYFEKINKD